MSEGMKIAETILEDRIDKICHALDREHVRKYQWFVYGATEALERAGQITEEEMKAINRIAREYGATKIERLQKEIKQEC